jgi:hypothetical protein
MVALVVLIICALVAAYIWSIVNGAAAVVTAATAVLVFAAGEFFTRRRSAQQYRWDKVAPIYEEFITLVRRLGKGDEIDTEAVMGTISDGLLLWGSASVISAWTASLRLTDTDPPPRDMVLAYAKVLLAIRKDLGHSDFTLEARDLLRVTITDIDQYLQPGEAIS